MIHELKTWSGSFMAIAMGNKTHDIRKADRLFSVGDVLFLREWDPDLRVYSGRQVYVNVTYVTKLGEWGLPSDVCVMSVRLSRRSPVES